MSVRWRLRPESERPSSVPSRSPMSASCGTRPGTIGSMRCFGTSAPLRPCLALTSSRTRAVRTDGSGWISVVEWDAEGVGQIFEDPENHLHPFAPDFSRWIEVLGRRGEVQGPVGELPECERRVLSAESVGSVLAVPVFVGADWWGFLGFDDMREERSWSEVEIERASSHGRRAGGRDRAATDGGDPPLHRTAVPIDRRAHPCHHVHRRGERASRVDLREPADRSGARVLPARVARRPRSLAEDHPPRRPCPRPRRERPPQ